MTRLCSHLSALTAAWFFAAASIHGAEKASAVGTLPVGKDGKPMNLDFEDGTLRDWTATGDAFKGQPFKGPIDQHRLYGEGKVAHQQGDYWIGGYEVAGDGPQGTLTSAPFKVTQPYAAFLLGGGSSHETRVELLRADTGQVIFSASGHDSETMEPVVVDLRPFADKEILVRLLDQSSVGWGHINFDDFRFYATKPEFARAAPSPSPNDLAPDQFKFAGLPPGQAAQEMTLPPGFRAKLFAGEPDVKQPIAFSIDDRGRIWVAEAYCYPIRQPEGKGTDRIICFEDTKGNGSFDKRTVFMEGLNLVSGLEVGFGGVWVGAAPYLMFIPMKDGDEPKPSGPPEILLDGWGYGDTHETLNTLTWGPDGWLYGCQGVFTGSNVGKPGAPDAERTRINAGVWRFHPLQKRFELFAEGTSNPWGIDFDKYGQCIIEGCVIPHLWHMIQGGHFQRQAGEHFNPNVYDDIKTIADHVHWAGGGSPHSGNGRSDSAGGGHAHAGLLIYQGASWPEKYNGQAFMNNIHGARINMDIMEAQGSGFVGHHGPDFILFNDLWSQIVNLQTDQDGSLYMIDWYDKNQCHNANPDAHDRTNGRIFKVVYNERKTTPVDLQKLSNAELVALQLQPNDWYVRHSRRILEERGASAETEAALRKIFAENPDPTRRVRALWALHVIGGLKEEVVLAALKDQEEHVRGWAIQLACEGGQPSPAETAEFARLAKDDPSPVVRLYLASAVQRIPAESRWPMVAALQSHADGADHNLPFMDWYALESVAAKDFHRALDLALQAKLPNTLEYTARRVAVIGSPEALEAVTEALARVGSEAPRQLAILRGMSAAFKGQRSVPEPKGWDQAGPALAASADASVRELAQALSLTFGSKRSLDSMRRLLTDSSAKIEDRKRALESLLNVKDPALPAVLPGLLKDEALRPAALRGLGVYADPETPAAILAVFPSLSAAEKRDALGTLASRPAFAKPLLAAMGDGRIAAKEVSADTARQIRQLNQPELTEQLEKVWGSARESSADKLLATAKYKAIILAKDPPVDLSRGREVFARTCGVCHKLYDAGGKIGPELTGSNRKDLDYLLHNIIDPNAEIPNEYRLATVELNDGRTLAGIAHQEDAKMVTVASTTETVTIPRSEVKKITLSEVSMMPEGILTTLSNTEVRDLIAYLQSSSQVPAARETAAK